MIVGGLLAEGAKKLKPYLSEPGTHRVEEVYRQPPEVQWNQDTFTGDAYPAYSWGVCALEVEVDPLTWEIRAKKAWNAFDVGKAIDRGLVTGQAEGGMTQGIGWGSLEVLEEKEGQIQHGTFTDYTIPTTLDVPEMDTMFFDNPYEHGPFGAKGAGELTFIAGAPALVSAVRQATASDPLKIPLTPEYLEELSHAD